MAANQQASEQRIFPAGSPVYVLSNGRRYSGTVMSFSEGSEYTVQLKVYLIRAHAMWVQARKVRAS